MSDEPPSPDAKLQQRIAELERQVAELEKALIPKSGDRVGEIHGYAWAWFSYHAQQRTSVFNFFLAAAALLFAGFGAAVNEDKVYLAAGIAGVGAIVSASFIAVDWRNQHLVNFGKDVLKQTEACWFATAKDGKPAFGRGIVLADIEPKGNCLTRWFLGLLTGKHRVHFRLLELVILAAFLFGGYFALWNPAAFEANEKEGSDADKIVQAIRSVDVSGKHPRLDASAGGDHAPPPGHDR